jgi:uncharacterized protein with von Willebrand factor type A (vWA) domain
MAPWRPFLQTLAESLALGKLRSQNLLYFSNVPRKWLFLTPSLDERIHSDEVVRLHGGLPLLIISDAGAARGHYSPQRVRDTAEFTRRAAREWQFRPIVWINPMSHRRWTGTSAGALARQSHLSVLALDKQSLIRAMDVLRGERSS